MPHSAVIRISFNWQFDQGLTKPLLSSVLWFGLVATWPSKTMKKNVDCWSAHCYALADGKRYHFNIDIIWQPNAIFSIKYQWNIRPHYSVELVLEFLFLKVLALLEIALLRQMTTVFSTLLAIITLWAELAIGGEITPLELGRIEGPSSEPSTLRIFFFKDALLIPSNLSYSSARLTMVLPFVFMMILPELNFVSNWK